MGYWFYKLLKNLQYVVRFVPALDSNEYAIPSSMTVKKHYGIKK